MASNNKKLPHNTPDWHGYTLDEIRYMRAYTAARIEINRDRIGARLAELGKTGKRGMGPKSIAGRIISAFSYIDMAVIAWKVGASALKLFRAVKR